MKLLFAHDTYYTRAPDGDVYSYGAFPYDLWKDRFLPHFDSVTVIGRDKEFTREAANLDMSSGARVEHILLPNINTPFKRLFGSADIRRKIEEQVRLHDAVVVRGPVEFGMIAAKAARKHNILYAVEMSGCAFDHSWYHGSLVGKLYAPIKYKRAQKMVRQADAVIYVTKHFLQDRYPTNGFAEYASNVEIDKPDDSVLEKRLRKIESQSPPLQFGMIGNFGNNLKGLDVALKALSAVKKDLPEFELHLLGQGDPAIWRNDITNAGLEGNVIFDGTRPGGQPVLDWLDNLDIYLHPSRHEGLPRSLIEAMSLGLPCLASDTGGIPELLDQDCIHHKENVAELSEHLRKNIPNKQWQIFQARKNFQIAQQYSKDVITPRRTAFWKTFKSLAHERASKTE